MATREETVYWRTLIQLEDPQDKDKLAVLCKKYNTSRSVLLGKLITKVLQKGSL